MPRAQNYIEEPHVPDGHPVPWRSDTLLPGFEAVTLRFADDYDLFVAYRLT